MQIEDPVCCRDLPAFDATLAGMRGPALIWNQILQKSDTVQPGPFSFQIGGGTTDPEGVTGFCPTWGFAWPARPA
jgi:hypothetical protein